MGLVTTKVSPTGTSIGAVVASARVLFTVFHISGVISVDGSDHYTVAVTLLAAVVPLFFILT
jgi:hypothetical protein